MFENIVDLPHEPTEEDGLVVYMIVNTDLRMSSGKIGGQCGHAIQYLMQMYMNNNRMFFSGNAEIFYNRMTAWLNSGKHSKVTLAADTKEFEKIKAEYNPIVVRDAGLTEIAAGSETVICLYPMFKSERTKLIKRLQALK